MAAAKAFEHQTTEEVILCVNGIRGGFSRDEMVPREKETWQFVRKKKREGKKHRTERCKDLSG